MPEPRTMFRHHLNAARVAFDHLYPQSIADLPD
jgi:hypothetical protein